MSRTSRAPLAASMRRSTCLLLRFLTAQRASVGTSYLMYSALQFSSNAATLEVEPDCSKKTPYTYLAPRRPGAATSTPNASRRMKQISFFARTAAHVGQGNGRRNERRLAQATAPAVRGACVVPVVGEPEPPTPEEPPHLLLARVCSHGSPAHDGQGSMRPQREAAANARRRRWRRFEGQRRTRRERAVGGHALRAAGARGPR